MANEGMMSAIRDARKAAGLSQQGVTDALGIPRRTLQDWETGKRTPPGWAEALIIEKLENMSGRQTAENWGSMTEVKPDPYITYKRVIYQGDTLWDVVGNTNQGREDLQELLYRVQMDNGITDPGRLQPGTEIKIRIKKH